MERLKKCCENCRYEDFNKDREPCVLCEYNIYAEPRDHFDRKLRIKINFNEVFTFNKAENDEILYSSETREMGGLKITKEMISSLKPTEWGLYQKKRLTQAIRIERPFQVETRRGPLTCPDGYLALDSDGWPYPIAKDEFEKIYSKVQSTD